VLLTDPVNQIPLIGKSYLSKLERLEIFSIADLLYHFPVKYLDTSEIFPLKELSHTDKKTIIAKLTSLQNIRLRNRKTMQKAIISDSETAIEVIWYNQPFIKNNLKLDTQYYFYGKLNINSLKPQLISPAYQLYDAEKPNIHLGAIVPVYSLTKGISNKWLRSRLHYLIEHLKNFSDLNEFFPDQIRNKYQLISSIAALKLIHFPSDLENLQASRRRLAFEELVNIQLQLLAEKKKHFLSKGPEISFNHEAINHFITNLPFQLNQSQQLAIQDIYEDFQHSYPMQRLLQGDVGSGKTIVAILSMLPVLQSGFQVVFLAPTAVLANQHYQLLQQIIPKKYQVALITAATSKKSQSKLKTDIIIGTHAILFHKNTLIHKLGIVIIDEQHKFGVKQRRDLLQLENSSIIPHFLYLTATPIPRTLAQTLFGDRDVSVIDKIAGRKSVQTRLVPETKRAAAITWIKEQIKNRNQVFWICPLIEEDPESEAKSILTYYETIKKEFSGIKIKFLHGKMKNTEKDQILEEYKTAKFAILLSTTVVEVGIDIPQANLMIIENAERYGLAQLHQLRGRVGRNNQEAWCLLFASKEDNQQAIIRLNYFAGEDNGIKIAEFDLKKRGPGEVYGIIQSGLPQLKVANFTNLALLKETRLIALEMLKK